jgi:hypothetical protein
MNHRLRCNRTDGERPDHPNSSIWKPTTAIYDVLRDGAVGSDTTMQAAMNLMRRPALKGDQKRRKTCRAVPDADTGGSYSGRAKLTGMCPTAVRNGTEAYAALRVFTTEPLGRSPPV